MSRLTQVQIRARHFGGPADDGRGEWSGHRPPDDFDFYCVAHEGDYSPAYLRGEVCHDGMGDGECHPDCRICPQPCSIDPCPIPWEADEGPEPSTGDAP